MKKLQYTIIIILGILLVGGIYSGVSYLSNGNVKLEEINVNTAYVNSSDSTVEFYVDSDGIYYCPSGKVMPKNGICGVAIGFVNPRDLILNDTDDEVVYRDHAGNIGGVGNIYFNTSGTSVGYFSYLGSSVTRIAKGWFDAIDTKDINATDWTNVTVTESQVSDLGTYATTVYVGEQNTSMVNYIGTINTSMKNYVDAMDLIFNNSIVNWIQDQFYTKTEVDAINTSMGNYVNSVNDSVTNALDSKLSLSGGNMTGVLNTTEGVNLNNNSSISRAGVGTKMFIDESGNMEIWLE